MLAIRYIKAEKLDSIVRAKHGLPNSGIIKITISNPDIETKYEEIKSVYQDMKESFKDSEPIDLSEFDI